MWSSLEVAKLLVSSLTPVAVLVLGVLAKRFLVAIERERWALQALSGYRMEFYREVQPLLNSLACFFLYIGEWKELSSTRGPEEKTKG